MDVTYPIPTPPRRRAWEQLRPGVYLVVGVLLLPTAFWCYRHGLSLNVFHWPETTSIATGVRRFNGAWIAGAFGLGILGAMLTLLGATELVRRRSTGARS